ncbi:phage recombination protein Bet [Novosphingobium chloroacetimidivorans]|uniref:Phage recombination protein Bet n=1 Tax=Novosphingobium chloroacetimidivorans TaxID=1428314 RepID=A0A7W7NXX5_9SPHN|nr:RecT family recombinase [Novosphingobium chloroacetimidivorans]MBB4859670.1 phage recombination protein Bet [Novosphingobium chloroacetimidivorans]
MNATTARSRAVANENRSIEQSQERAIAARTAEQSRPRNALEAMSSRLEVSPGALKDTLLKTVFATCRNDSEFIGLVIVSNAYGLNPLLKEIYAFPAKGGGVVPMVSVDGWIKLMHSHPAYDSIEFEDIADDKGAIYAIEATIWRTDKTRPTKIIEYLDECRRNTDPWKQSPLRMLRHRALIQCARVAFGFSGLSALEDTVIDAVAVAADDVKALPNRQSLAEQLDDEIPSFDQAHDPSTGEVYPTDDRGMTPVDEETARALDSNDGTLSEDNPHAAEGPDSSQRGEANTEVDELADLRRRLGNSRAVKAVEAIERDWVNTMRNRFDDDTVATIEREIAARKLALKPQQEG